MKKKAEILGIVIATGIVLSANAFYQDLTEREAGSAQPKITTSTQAATAPQNVKPQSTANATALEQKEEPTAEKEKYALWHYDKKTRRLTISGNGELLDESPDNAEGEADTGKVTYTYGIYNRFPEDLNIGVIRKKVREVVIEPGITVINTSAFYYFEKLEKVTIPDSVRKIKKYAFYGCESLKEVTIPDHVETIGGECFFRCNSLKKISLGQRVSQIGEAAFGDSPKIQKVTVNPKNKHLITKNGSLYHKQKKILYLNYSKATKITVKKGTKKIAAFACQWNKNLRQITIPASVTVIGGGAMYQCTNLRKVNFAKRSKLKNIKEFYRPDEITGVYGCFEKCKRLEQISLPDSLESM